MLQESAPSVAPRPWSARAPGLHLPRRACAPCRPCPSIVEEAARFADAVARIAAGPAGEARIRALDALLFGLEHQLLVLDCLPPPSPFHASLAAALEALETAGEGGPDEAHAWATRLAPPDDVPTPRAA